MINCGGNMVTLRDMRKKDIKDYVKWFTIDTEWSDIWDSPWKKINTTVEYENQSWTEYFHYVSNLKSEEFREKFEIDYNGKHVGWVSCYLDLEYIDNNDNILAVGIDIPEEKSRGKGVGTEALKQFIQYLFSKGKRKLFIQTWSENTPMLKVIEKLIFKDYYRRKEYREVCNQKYDAITFMLEIN